MSPDPYEADADPESGKERLKQEVWAFLAPIPTTLRRLVYLSSLYDENTGQYHGSRLRELRGEVEGDAVLREIHEDVFRTWLSFSLEDQHEELKEHLELLRRKNAPGVEVWLTLAPYERLVPAQADAASRELFRSDLEFLLGMLKGRPA